MNYIKIYFSNHLKFWYIYLFILITFIPAYVISIFLAMMLTSCGMNDHCAWIFVIIMGGLILSSPVLFINYKIASDAKKSGISKIPIWGLMLTRRFSSI